MMMPEAGDSLETSLLMHMYSVSKAQATLCRHTEIQSSESSFSGWAGELKLLGVGNCRRSRPLSAQRVQTNSRTFRPTTIGQNLLDPIATDVQHNLRQCNGVRVLRPQRALFPQVEL